MSRLTTTVTALGAGALALSLAACGGSDNNSQYCSLISDAEMEYSSLTEADPTDVELISNVSSAFDEIAAVAPDDINGDWQTVASGWQTLTQIDVTDPDAEVDENAFAGMEAAYQNIAEHVQQECELDMSVS